MIRRAVVLAITCLFWLSMPAHSAHGDDPREFLRFVHMIGKDFDEGRLITRRLYGVEGRISDYFNGYATQDILRGEVTDELIASEKEIEAFNERLAQLSPVPELSNPSHTEIARAHVDAIHAFADEMRLLLDNTRELMNAAFADDTERFNRAMANSLRLEAQGLHSMNRILRLILDNDSEDHPRHGLFESIIATNRAHGLFLNTMAEAYGESYRGFAPVSEDIIAALEEARLAVSRGRENIINIVEPFRDAVVLDVVVEGWESTPKEKEEEALVQRIGESFHKSFEIEEKLIDTLREFHDFYVRVSAHDLPVRTVEYFETHASLGSAIYELFDHQVDESDERNRLILELMESVYDSN